MFTKILPAGVPKKAAKRLSFFLFLYCLNHTASDDFPFPGLKVAQGDISNLDTNESQSGKANSCSHMAYLPIFPFDEGETYPTGRNGGTIADGRHPVPQPFGRLYHLCPAWLGFVSFDDYSFG